MPKHLDDWYLWRARYTTTNSALNGIDFSRERVVATRWVCGEAAAEVARTPLEAPLVRQPLVHKPPPAGALRGRERPSVYHH